MARFVGGKAWWTLAFVCALLARPAVASATPCAEDPGRLRSSLVHRLLELEAVARPVPAEKLALADEVVCDALGRIGAAKGASPEISPDAAPQILHAVDEALLAHNFIQPLRESDWPETLTEALTPHAFSPGDLEASLGSEANARRRYKIDRAKPVFYVDCDKSSFFYLAVARLAGIDLRLVELPQHNFVRWLFPRHPGVNWDPVLGRSVSDAEYRRLFSVSDRQVEQKVYLASLSDEQMMGYFYSLRSSLWPAERRAEALADAETGVRLYPTGGTTRNNLAWKIVTTAGQPPEKLKDALAYALQSLAEFPDNANRLDTLACCYAALGDLAFAATLEERAIPLAQDEQRVRELTGRAKGFRGGKTCVGLP